MSCRNECKHIGYVIINPEGWVLPRMRQRDGKEHFACKGCEQRVFDAAACRLRDRETKKRVDRLGEYRRFFRRY